MPFRQLSEQTQQLSNPQKSDAFVRLFRAAVREGRFDAVDMPGRFTLPKQYQGRKEGGSFTRNVREMVFEVTPAFERWFEETNEALSHDGRRKAQPKPSLEAFESGDLDFRALARQTRDKLNASFQKGRQLGQARKTGRAKASAKRPTGRAKAGPTARKTAR